MEYEKGKISNLQLMFSIGCFIQGSTLLSAFVISVTKQDSWLVVLTGFALSLLIVAIYLALIRMHPGKSLLEMFEAAFGKVLGKLVSLLYLFFFLSLAGLNSRDVGSFVMGYIMQRTPIIAILIMFVFVCGWAVRHGVETMVRYSFFFVIVSFVVLGFIFLLLVKDMHLESFFPAFTLPPKAYIQGTHVVAVIPFCEIIVFLMVVPSLDDQNKTAGAFLKGLLIGGATLFFIVVRDISTLGGLISYVTLPSYEAVKLIDVAHILTRMEVLYAIELLFLQFFKVSFLYYAMVLGIAQVFNLRTYKPYILTVGVLIVSFSLFVFDSPMQNAYWGSTVAPFYSTVFVLVFPLLAFLASLIRGAFRKAKVGRA